MLLLLQGEFWGKIKYHIFAVVKLSFDTEFCNRKYVLQDTWIMATLHGELISFFFSQKLCIDQNIMKRYFCVKVNQCVRWWDLYGHISVPFYTLDWDLITFSVKIMQQSKFSQWTFSSQCSSMSFVMVSESVNIHTALLYHIQL
jgi:hypothetical protein